MNADAEWLSCDGEILSSELIRAQMNCAVQDERYEYAAKCKKELERRRNKKGRVL